MQIEILGTKYDFQYEDEPIEFDISVVGNVDYYKKTIVVEKNHKKLQDKIARHELIHAYFYEAGLPDYAQDEVLVEWLALQFPKILEIFKKLENI